MQLCSVFVSSELLNLYRLQVGLCQKLNISHSHHDSLCRTERLLVSRGLVGLDARFMCLLSRQWAVVKSDELYQWFAQTFHGNLE